ncbi:hypothetical protein FLX27_05580 [Agrobacterium tumefaciens]|nr:hypothetical protein FLX27_05580 [Agrobacterium tumefaciens]
MQLLDNGSVLAVVFCGGHDALQPCGGTHVSCSGEVRTVRVSKIENKGRSNRRVTNSVA